MLANYPISAKTPLNKRNERSSILGTHFYERKLNPLKKHTHLCERKHAWPNHLKVENCEICKKLFPFTKYDQLRFKTRPAEAGCVQDASLDQRYNATMITNNKYTLAILLSIILCNCSEEESAATKSAADLSQKMGEVASYRPEVMSLLGKELKAPYIDSVERTRRQAAANEARAALNADPESEEKAIWHGRRTAYLGQFNDAIIIFSDGLMNFTDSYRLRRHRGHRFITRRQFVMAIKDLERAVELIKGVDDEIEADGMPNDKNIPRSTTHSNIYYHLGLARYLLGDYSGAAEAYRRNVEFCANDDMLCANTYWLYLSLRNQGENEAALAVLAAIETDMDVIENFAYHKLLLAYKGAGEGDGKVDELLGSEGIDSIEDVTLAYGVGAWHLLQGDANRAKDIFEKIVEGPNWPAFGHIAAEVHLANKRK